MKIDSYTALGGPETIAFIDAPIPHAAGEVLIRVPAALGQQGDVMSSNLQEILMFSTFRHIAHSKTSMSLTLAVGSMFVNSSAHAADLIVLVNNVQQDTGQVLLGLFNTAQNFPKTISQSAFTLAKERSAGGQVRLVIKGLAPGQYAASAFHDLDSNNKLNRNLMGLPTEPYGFSNSARGNFSPPAFKEAAITVGELDVTIEITVK